MLNSVHHIQYSAPLYTVDLFIKFWFVSYFILRTVDGGNDCCSLNGDLKKGIAEWNKDIPDDLDDIIGKIFFGRLLTVQDLKKLKMGLKYKQLPPIFQVLIDCYANPKTTTR